MPEELRDLLTERSRANGRSLNAEIIGILQDAIGEQRQPSVGLDVDGLAEAIAAKVAEKLSLHKK
jgi:plasmid stability protein